MPTFRHLLAALLLCWGTGAVARVGEVAITFDDLPALTILPDQSYVDYLTETLIRKLRRNRVPAIGFVNEGKLDELNRPRQILDLQRWLDAGMELGNHTFSHESLNDVGVRAYVADIAKGEEVTRPMLSERHQSLRYFRPPYLETGRKPVIREAVENWLAHHGYQLVPVTIDADDWEFAEPYDDAIARRNKRLQQHIRAEYLAHTARHIAWSQRSARILFGRDIAQIMLLHATRLNADTFDDLARLLRRARLRPVSVEAAMRDPVYDQPSTYAGADGIDWLERWASTRKIVLPDEGNDDPPADIVAAYKRVDNDLN